MPPSASSSGRRKGRPTRGRARPAAPVRQPLWVTPPPAIVRSDAGLWGYERALRRVGFRHVAGVDEAGRGACAGPLVVAAVVLPEGRRGEIPGLADSKLLHPDVREEVYEKVVARAVSWAACVIPTGEVDRRGVHVANVTGMRRAVARLAVAPSYTLTDGFPIPGMPSPACAVWKGDQVVGCVAAASVVAKVTRDRLMRELDGHFPQYGFAAHKGYCTPEHDEALRTHGPCHEHRFSFVNVRQAAARVGAGAGMPASVRVFGQDDGMPEFATAHDAAQLETGGLAPLEGVA